MNKGNTATGDGGLVISSSSVGYTCSGQLLPSTAIVTSAKLSAIHVTSKSNGDRVAKPSPAPTPASPSSHQPALSSTGNTASPNTNASNATSKGPFEDVNFRIKYVDKETKSKSRSTISKFMEYSSFVSSPHFSESMKKHLLLNGNAQPFLNHDACAAQVRTIMKAAGLTPEKVTTRSKLKVSRSSNFASSSISSISSHKMTLMAELFASEEEDGDDEAIFEDEIEDHLNMVSNSHHLDSEDVEYEEEEEEDDDDEDVPGDGGDEGDDEEEDDMSEIDSFTLEDDTLNSKFLMSVDSSDNPHASGRLYKNDIELHFSNIPESLTASATNVAVEHFTDSQLYHELQFASSDVHHVLDEVGATIAKMRISDTNLMPYLVHKLQEEVLHHSNTRAANPSTQYANKMSSESRNLKPSVVQHCHLSALAPFNLTQHVSEEDANASDDILEDGVIHDAALLEETAEKTVQFSLDELQRKDSDKLLLYAAASGHFDMVKLLLSTQKINIDKRGVKEMTPLMEAASGGFLDIVRLLIDHGADVNCKTQQGNSALMYSCAMGHLEVVKELISHGASIEDQNENGHTALMEAASAGHAEVARFLVSQGCNINVHSNEYKETALTLAAYKGHFEMVRFLINAGAGQEHRAEEMHTALMEASMDGHVEVARLLIDSGAQVNMPPDSFESPLTLAACGGHVELALLLLERGANIEEVNDEGYTALMEAAREGHEEMVALLISHKAKVNATTEESKETALFMACGAGCVEVVNLLIKAGADIELGTSTPLMEASQEGHIEIVKRLLDAKAKVNATNSAGETALNLAAENGHTGVINLLIVAGAEVDHCVEGGKTALMKAAQMGHHDAVLQLVNAKADVNRTTSNNEQTALSMACSGGHVQVVEVLLQAGADLFHRLKDNSTMLIEAAKGGHTNVVQVLIDYHYYKSNGGVHPTFLDNTLTQPKVVVPGVRPPDAPTPTKAPQPVNLDYDHEESLAALREKLSSMGIQDTYPTMPPEVPTFLAAADSTMQLAASVSSSSPCATTPLTTSQSQSTASTPLASSCSAPFTNLQTNVSLPIVSYSNEFNFNFASKLYKKESEPGTTNNTNNNNNTTTTTSTTSQANTPTVTLTTASPKDTDLFKRIKSSKSAPTSKSTPLNLPPMAATVSINTNTTSTATTAVCVGTLMPQGNGQTTETTSFSQSTIPPNPAPTTAVPLAAPKITSFTATTKSITKVKNAIGSQAKALVADASTGTISSSPACTHGQTRHGIAVIPPQASAAPVAPSPPAVAASSGQQTKSSKAAAPSIDLNSQTDSNHDTALTLACAGGHEDLVKLLLARGADIEHREKKGLSPLMLAATNGHAKIVDILFSHGADLEAQTERTKDTALSLACSSGRYEVVENLLSRGANKEHRNVSDYTPLSLAASGGYVTIINLLLSYGAEINSRTGSKLGISPLMLAAMNGHTDTTRLLLDRGSDINAYIETNRNTALTLACFQGRTEVVGLLLDRNANIEHRAKTGLTPLMEAASGGYVDVGRVLLDKGADVNAPPVPASRDTALTIAADKGHALFVELLILGGAMVDVKNKKGYSPLWLACNGGHFEVATILVNAKCDVDSQDNRKISCLMASFKRGHVKIVKFLVKHVSQFPSDQEISRCLALCTEEELNKKASLCADILHQAKERQAAEAYKNAANLLEEIDQERNRDESRKAAAARRRERRKQKKKAEKPDNEDDDVDDDDDKFEESPDSKSADKLMKDDESKEDDEAPKPKKKKKKKKSKKSALASAETTPAADDDDDEDTTAVTIDDDDFDCYDELPEEYPEDVPIMNLIADMVSKAELKKKLKKKSTKSKAPDTSKAAEPMAPPAAPVRAPEPTPVVPVAKVSEPVEILTVIAAQPCQPDKKNVKKNSKTQAKAKESQPPVPVTEKPKDVLEVTKPKSVDLPFPSQTFKNKNVEEPAEKANPIVEATKVADSKTIVTDYSDLDDDSSWNEPTFIVKSYSRHGKNGAYKKGETGLANSGSPNQHSSAPGMGKREEGWKEVVRKSKKVVVPANAISRVIGRGGCNINTIREVSGAHIEVEKQKGQGDRMVIIRGSADATRHAHQLITVLSKETEKELTEIIRELGLDMLSQSVPTVASSTAPSSTASAPSVTSSAASVDEAPLASTIVSDSAESSQSGVSGQVDISSTASNSRSSKSKAMQSALGSKTTNVATNSTATASSPLVYTSSSTSLHSKNSKSPSSASNDSNWTYGSTGKAALQPVSASSTSSNTASYTMAVNSKTRSTTTTTTSSSKSSNGVKIMSAVYKPSNKSQIHTNSSYGSSRNHHSSSSKSTESNHGEALSKGSVSPSNVSKSTTSGFEANNKLISEPTIPSSFSSVPESMPLASTVEPSDSEYTPFNSLYSGNSLWTNCKTTGKANVLPAGNINCTAPAAPIAAIGSGFTQKQVVEISVDESKAPGFNRQQFVSPGSFSTSSTSSFSSASAMPPLNISTNTASMPQHMLGPIGPVRSAPCTPPISSATANNQFGRTPKFVPGQPPQPLGLVDLYGNPLSMVDTIAAIAAPKSQILDSFMTNVSADIMKPPTDFATSLQQSAQSNLFPSMNPEDKFSGSSQSMFNARQMNFLDINSSSSLYGHAAMANANANRASSLNPNAPDFPSRSNSFSANPLSHPSLMSHANSTNSLNGSNSSIASGAGFSNLAGAPSRPGYSGMQVNAPPISNTAVRAAIVNYSMNLFQNQVPKQHQEAAARLAHLSAQNPNFANNEFQNVFIGNGSANTGGANSSVNVNAPNTNGTMHSAAVGNRESTQQQQVPDKVRLLQYMYQQQGQFKPSSSMSGVTNTSTFAQSQNAFNANNFGQQTQFGVNALARGPSSLNSATFSTANLESSLTSSLFSSSGMNNIANTNAELADDCLQRMKAPAPIGTERAQRKMPMHAFGPVSQGPASLSANQHAIGIPNANSLNSNSLFADQSFGNPWNMGNSADSMNTPAESIFSNSHSGLTSSFNADYSDLFLSNNLSELNQLDSYSTMMNQRQQPMQASAIPGQKFNSMNLMDGLTFDSSSQMPSNTFKGLNNTGNSLFPNANPAFAGGNATATNIDSDYWSSSSSSSIAKQTPNCSTSGMNAAFDNKLGWNNWNS